MGEMGGGKGLRLRPNVLQTTITRLLALTGSKMKSFFRVIACQFVFAPGVVINIAQVLNTKLNIFLLLLSKEEGKKSQFQHFQIYYKTLLCHNKFRNQEI